MSESSAHECVEWSPAWVDVVELVGNVGNTVLVGVRGDLADRGARRAVVLVQLAGGVGTALLRRRCQRPRSADLQLVSTVMRDARDRGDLDVAEYAALTWSAASRSPPHKPRTAPARSSSGAAA